MRTHDKIFNLNFPLSFYIRTNGNILNDTCNVIIYIYLDGIKVVNIVSFNLVVPSILYIVLKFNKVHE